MTTDHALILAGHGSHRNPGSAAPVLAHADRIRSRGIFSEVRAAFWKEEPALRQVLRTIASETVFVVPVMMSEGYFVDQVFPRELGLTDHTGIDLDKSVHYTPPVGTHPAMTDVVVNRAKTVTENPHIGPGVGLILVGHGTERNAQSAATTYRHAERVRARDRFDEVTALFMDEAPAITDWESHVESDEIIVVPFFVADGYHTQEDIPTDLGLAPTATGTYPVPGFVNDRQLWYTGAVGTDQGLADVIVERARDAAARPLKPNTEGSASPLTEHEEAFLSWIEQAEQAERKWGELLILARNGNDEYAVRHYADRGVPLAHLDRLSSAEVLRDRTRFDDAGEYRPLRGDATLPTGWYAKELSGKQLVRVVDFVYPASIPEWARLQEDDLAVGSFQETARRQTGLYAGLEAISPHDLASTISACCDSCVKCREWDAVDVAQTGESRDDGRIPCREPCSFVIAAAKEFMELEPTEEPAQRDPSVRAGDVSKPGNRYRVRYRDAHRDMRSPASMSGGQG